VLIANRRPRCSMQGRYRSTEIKKNRREPPVDRRRHETESSLLAELAKEAAEATGAGEDTARNRRAVARHVHETLREISSYLGSLCEYANCIGPKIRRVYRLDTRTAYTNLEWRDAFVSTRSRELRERALLDHVTFSVYLH